MSLEYMVTMETLITCERFPIVVTKSSVSFYRDSSVEFS